MKRLIALIGAALIVSACSHHAPPPPPPPPPPPMHASEYVVYFDFGKANLNGDAAAVLTESVSAVRDGRCDRVLIEGYSDTVGREERRMELSDRRAHVAADRLSSMGIDGGMIEVKAHGSIGPNGHDRDPRNRKVVITLLRGGQRCGS